MKTYGVRVIGNSGCSDDPSGVQIATKVLDIVTDYFALAFVTRAPSEGYGIAGYIDDSWFRWVLGQCLHVRGSMERSRGAHAQGRRPRRVA